MLIELLRCSCLWPGSIGWSGSQASFCPLVDSRLDNRSPTCKSPQCAALWQLPDKTALFYVASLSSIYIRPAEHLDDKHIGSKRNHIEYRPSSSLHHAHVVLTSEPCACSIVAKQNMLTRLALITGCEGLHGGVFHQQASAATTVTTASFGASPGHLFGDTSWRLLVLYLALAGMLKTTWACT